MFNASVSVDLSTSTNFNLNAILGAILIIDLSTNKNQKLRINTSINRFIFRASFKAGLTLRSQTSDSYGT